MKIYEKPMVEIKKFDVEDIITTSEYSFDTSDGAVEDGASLSEIAGTSATIGIAFQW